MRRCFDLAARGHGHVSPNPTVGAVLVYAGRILGEGWHRHFGGPHAEVEAIGSVPEDQRSLLEKSTLYISLEPCCITGKTPPCTELILRSGISRVVISTPDPNPAVAGRGLALLKAHGVDVSSGVLAPEGKALVRAFATNILRNRPHITLKWAQSRSGHYAPGHKSQWLSEPYTQVWTHRLRAEHDAILVGARTVMIDNPALTTRAYPGRSPHRIIYDPAGRLPHDRRVFAKDETQVYYATTRREISNLPDHLNLIQLPSEGGHLEALRAELFPLGIGRLLVEGGAYLQREFIHQDAWDEAWVIRTASTLREGLEAPRVHGRLAGRWVSGSDEIVGILRGA